MATNLSGRHHETVRKIFAGEHNVEWREAESLLEAIGTVTEEHNGNIKVQVGPETEVFHSPRGKNLDIALVVDLRRMLKQAGYAPDGSPEMTDTLTRDHGDGQWGEPS